MKIEKYALCYGKGLKHVSNRHGITPLVTPTDAAILYAMRMSPSTTYSGLYRFFKRWRGVNDKDYNAYLNSCLAKGLITKDGTLYMLTPLGREFLHDVRQYLLNIRWVK